MSETAQNEVAVLSSIYCEKDEFVLLEESVEKGILFRIQLPLGTNLSLVFRLPPEYPSVVPDVCVSSQDLGRAQCHALKERLLQEAQGLRSQPMVHQLLLWLQHNASDLIASRPESQQESGCDGQMWTALLLIDHMRAKAKYVRQIEKWTTELDLTGRLFIGKLILVLLQGRRPNIKEYLHLQRTAKVDVDSTGRKCKERMMSVLCERPLSEEQKRLAEFEVKEVSSLEHLKMEFDSAGVSALYQEFVCGLNARSEKRSLAMT